MQCRLSLVLLVTRRAFLYLALDSRYEAQEVVLQHVVVRPGAHRGNRHLVADATRNNDERNVASALSQEFERRYGTEAWDRIVCNDDVPICTTERRRHVGGTDDT